MSNIKYHTTAHADTTTYGGASTGCYAAAFAVSAGIMSVLSSLLVVLKETNEDTVLAWMKAATGHHWVTHGLIDLILFVLIGLLISRSPADLENRPGTVVGSLVGGVVLGAAIVAGFFRL